MESYPLCSFCKKCHPIGLLAKSASECHICRGKLEKLPALVAEAIAGADFEWITFGAQSSLPREDFAREEDLWDTESADAGICVKNAVNAAIVASVEEKTGKKSGKNPDAVFAMDFLSMRGKAVPQPIFVFGRYNKLGRETSQSEWHCRKCRGSGCSECGGKGVKFASVEAAICNPAKRLFEAKECTFHAAGREDIDAQMLGDGRPFVLRVNGARKRGVNLRALEAEIAKTGTNFRKNLSALEYRNSNTMKKSGGAQEMAAAEGARGVLARSLKFVSAKWIEIVCNSHFGKEYFAIVALEREPTEEDVGKINAIKNLLLLQQTPLRVMQRRSDLVRKRRIYSASASIEGGKLSVQLFAEAGTYIKEFASGDGGRTKPSLVLMLGCGAKCELLNVERIHDAFVEYCDA
jgi:tRNA pseudouridine synthase 10